MARLLGPLERLIETIQGFSQQRIEHFGGLWRTEVRRLAMAIASALALSFFVCAAATFAIFSVLLAFWETHRVLTASLGAVVFAMLATAAALLLRSCTRAAVTKND